MDPSGFVTGWAIAGAMRRLQAAAARNASVNGSGDIVVIGHPEGDSEWRVGIQHPREPDQLAYVLALESGAVATSGTYARGLHVIDPHTGRAPADLLSVSIVGADLALADVYATTAFATGAERGSEFCASLSGIEAILICQDDTF